MISIAVTGTITRADDCRPLIESCDKALADKKREIELCKLGLTQTIDQTKQLIQDVQDRDAKLSSMWRNPFFLIPLGLAAGMVTHAILK